MPEHDIAKQPQTILLNDSTIRVFISYRNTYPSDQEAARLAEKLRGIDFNPDNIFFDQTQLKAGDIWAQKIYDNIRKSDVLIVLLQAGQDENDSTAKSEWVQREVDVARGGHISILPIKLAGEDDLIITSQVAEFLAIRDRQFLTYASPELWLEVIQRNLYEESIRAVPDQQAEYNELDKLEQKKLHEKHFQSLSKTQRDDINQDVQDKSNHTFAELVELINTLSQRTRIEQRKWMIDLQQLRRKGHAENHPNIFALPLDETGKRKIHLATGDLTEFADVQIDVIVNSENDYMQLARMYEFNSLSVTLRIKGAYFVNGRLMDDRVQNELTEQVRLGFAEQGLPLMLGEVILTHAGHPQSTLVKHKGFRYIFHAATIHFDAIFSDEPLSPINSKLGITTVIKNCLDKVEEVNALEGEILHQDSIYTDNQADFEPIRSIIFPLFATGQAGRSVDKVIAPICTGIKDWMGQHPKTTLTDIYISVFVEDHIKIVKAEMKRQFG